MHLDSALVVAEQDPSGAHTLLYDAARLSLAAVLQAHLVDQLPVFTD